MVMAPGAFVCLGLILAGMNALNRYLSRRKGEPLTEPQNTACASCAGCNLCITAKREG
jgi:electron transport complex protein RnfE